MDNINTSEQEELQIIRDIGEFTQQEFSQKPTVCII